MTQVGNDPIYRPIVGVPCLGCLLLCDFPSVDLPELKSLITKLFINIHFLVPVLWSLLDIPTMEPLSSNPVEIF